jgi:hypothetical protein
VTTDSPAPISPAAAQQADKRWPGAFAAISESLNQVLKNPQPALLYAATSAAVGSLTFILSGGYSASEPTFGETYSSFIGIAVAALFLLANRNYALAVADKRNLSISEYMRFNANSYVSLLIVSLLTYMMWGLSFLFFIIPLIWTVGWFYMAQFRASERGGDPIQALKYSRAISRNHKGKVWGIFGAVILIILLSFIPIFVLIIIPFVGLIALTFIAAVFELIILGAFAILYRWLVRAAETDPAAITSPASPAKLQ